MKISRYGFRLCVLAAFLAAALVAQSQNASEQSQHYLQDIKTLTSPAMEGRGDGTAGLTRAAEVLVQRYKSLGLVPAGTKSFYQPFTVITGAQIKGENHFRVQNSGIKSELKLNQDFVPFSFSTSGSATAPVVFAGYGITAPDFSYDDYSDVDVKDKIVLLLRHEPAGFAAKSGNSGETLHAQIATKAINARNHGARAVVLVNGNLPPNEEDVLFKFGSVSGPVDSGIVILQMKNAQAESWFKLAGKSLTDVQNQIDHASKPSSFAFPAQLTLSVAVDVEHTKATVNNVLAYLPGQTDEYVVLGAHYDHLGRGDDHSLAPSLIGQIHPGADDNASGAAGTLELAEHFAAMKGKLRRGILFANFAGEELGLLGSSEWVQNPTRPLEKAIAMINLDMIGRITQDKIYVGGVGTGSTFKSVLEQAQAKTPFTVEYSSGGYASSDHTSFVSKKIPVLFFFSGLHSDYHKPSDTWEKINSDSAIKLLDLVANATEAIDDDADRPGFVVVAEDRPAVGTSGGNGYGAYFGSIPDFGQIETGVKFADVKPGSPAAKAGLKGGDVLIQFGDKAIKNLYDFTDVLRRGKPGDTVEVTVLRDGKPMKVPVTLEQRK
jgi:hypothetical protein